MGGSYLEAHAAEHTGVPAGTLVLGEVGRVVRAAEVDGGRLGVDAHACRAPVHLPAPDGGSEGPSHTARVASALCEGRGLVSV